MADAASTVAKNKTVTTKHADYIAMSGKWSRCRDAAAGQDAIRKNSLNYLPMLSDQTPEAYQAYVMRASFFNATWRTVQGMTGMLFRKPEVVDVPAGIKPYLADITMSGEALHVFVTKCAEECFVVGRVGIMVDYPTLDPANALTVAQSESMGLRPTMQRYTTESIINWRTQSIGNVTKLTLVVLTEIDYKAVDEFSGETEVQYRVLELVPSDAGMVYRMRLFRINPATDSQEQIGADIFPLKKGKPLTDIPFFFLGTDSIDCEVDAPPLIDLVDLNIAHFRVSADYEHGCHFTGLPTPVISGYNPPANQGKLYLGSTAAWVFPDPLTRATFLEFSGAGLGTLERNLDRKEAQMATLGARLLAADKRMNETATTAAIHHGGETSILSAVAQVLSIGITKALTIFSEWSGVDTTVDFSINRDFFPVPMDAPTLTALVGAWQAGAISQETLFENLQEGEIISSENTFEKESAKIQNDPPPPPPAGAVKPSSAKGSQSNLSGTIA